MTTAIKRRFENVVIRASAGTGKTFQLTNRFIGLVSAGEPLDTILATTFTRKAGRRDSRPRSVSSGGGLAGCRQTVRNGPTRRGCHPRPRPLPGRPPGHGARLAPDSSQHARQFLHSSGPRFQPRTGTPSRLANRRRPGRSADPRRCDSGRIGEGIDRRRGEPGCTC